MAATTSGSARPIERSVSPVDVVEGAGVRLKRSFPTRALDYPDPFLLFDHFGSDDPKDYMAGFPMHPHRGIETVTYMLSGAVSHRDSLGNSGVIEAGDVQWMSAGGGIMHEEMPQARNGRMEGFQLWVNLPARLKLSRPQYQGVEAESIPLVTRPDGIAVRIVAGAFDGVVGPVTDIAADPTYLDVTIPPGGHVELPIPPGHTVLAYLFRGAGTIGATPVASSRLLVLGDGDHFAATAGAEGMRFLLISGQGSGEPIVRYGPFVMNTQEEIMQALQDLRAGTFVRQ